MEKYNGLTVTAPEGAADTSSLTADAATPGGELPRRSKRGHPGVSPHGEGFEVEQSSKNCVSFNSGNATISLLTVSIRRCILTDRRGDYDEKVEVR
ncbi:MAG: hypothetical protein IJP02_03045 [Oscillospiraceae bacterium]|nr:hypothetical protein [Oscillospiraceae bacterium]